MPLFELSIFNGHLLKNRFLWALFGKIIAMRGQEHYRKLIMIYSNFPYLPIIASKSDDFTDGYPLIIRLKCKFRRRCLRNAGWSSKAQAKKNDELRLYTVSSRNKFTTFLPFKSRSKVDLSGLKSLVNHQKNGHTKTRTRLFFFFLFFLRLYVALTLWARITKNID